MFHRLRNRRILGFEQGKKMKNTTRKIRNDSDPFGSINRLKGKVTMLFITHQIPRGLQVDAVFSFGNDSQHNTKVGVVEG